ncbi:peptide deformylase, mitochondrial-like [Dendronephthya gigantea]|uniref:peptide deformylase, mitochondrial-like n=1 Tax=Dendronephthya gigantea TaxID=151771 RepID=UPI00106CA4CC|nr:peptide deformylase, mitochondrial-like [Dendronephthya gigantea]
MFFRITARKGLLKNILKSPKCFSILRREKSSWMETLKSTIVGTNVPKVRQIGDPVLREVAQPVDPITIQTADFQKLLEVMIKTMRSHQAVGIAAPQIGVGLQVFAMEHTQGHMNRLKEMGFTLEDLRQKQMDIVPLKVFINPELKITNSKMVAFREGCLSLEGFSGVVPRALEVEVRGLNENGEAVCWNASGWPARIVQHEIDHLRGNIYIDSMTYKSFMNNKWNDFVE